MFNFFSSFKTDVRQAIVAIHDRFVTLETKIEALMSHAKEVAPAPEVATPAVDPTPAPAPVADTSGTTSSESK